MSDTHPDTGDTMSRFWQGAFVVLMAGLTVLFVVLGFWQLDRLAEKEAEIAAVEARFGQPAIALPPVAEWPAIDPEALNYRTVALEGTFDYENSVLVFDNLLNARGQYSGVGYWVMTPFIVNDDDGLVWVNRGFVPDYLADSYTNGGVEDPTVRVVEGVARRPERSGPFTPGSDFANQREWVRDPERLSGFLEGYAQLMIAPITIDMPAGERGALPQGGETQISFSNRHLEYAGTWFIFAAITPIMLGFWLWRQRRPKKT